MLVIILRTIFLGFLGPLAILVKFCPACNLPEQRQKGPVIFGKIIKTNKICQNNLTNKSKGFTHNPLVHKLVMPWFVLEKSVQGSYNQFHSKVGETASMQCSRNALLAICWEKFRKVSCWKTFSLDFVLDENLFKSFGLYRYLDRTCLNI